MRTKVAGSGFDLRFYATNLTNKLYQVENSNLHESLLLSNSLHGEPRMYGARALCVLNVERLIECRTEKRDQCGMARV